jgi:ATP-binding cassette subfamily F protein uup
MTILMQNPNFLILDEPTNDLDIFILGVLEDYLAQFEGCLIIVSHDRYFLDKLVEHTFYFKGAGEVKDILGNYTAYRSYLAESAKNETKKSNHQKEDKEPAQNTRSDKPKVKLSYKEQQEFDKLDEEIAALEKERDELTGKLNAGVSGEEASQVAMRLNEVADLLDQKEMRWLELSEFA